MTGNHNRDIIEAFLLNFESLQIAELKMPYRHNKGPKINVMWGHPYRWPCLFRIQIKWLNSTLHRNRIFHFSLVDHPPLGLGNGVGFLSATWESVHTSAWLSCSMLPWAMIDAQSSALGPAGFTVDQSALKESCLLSVFPKVPPKWGKCVSSFVLLRMLSTNSRRLLFLGIY